jgi:hypothetical protein
VAGVNGATTITVAGVTTKDTLVSVVAEVVATGLLAEDLTSKMSITAANTLTSTDDTDYSTGHVLRILYLRKGMA